ncbi:hypothetical protein HGP28_02700 [Vibrio sp. SM6]|uniref:Spondin domain-containing protein n=1 Tax=Vibrio agarilyticus TaxID=2726741 RepID=A0A7X8YFE0_9VIBR|nr:spondin domain-containing protein [Vibrio agarilyticus]NLS11798.1 hypothetical protein [Vibrio agarilyticus]
MNTRLTLGLLASSLTLGATAQAAELDITFNNVTKGIYFTPLLFAAHDGDAYLFRTGKEASAALELMAEGGDISELSTIVGNIGGAVYENPANGPLNPSTSIAFSFDTGDNQYLTVTAMLLPTNDGFVGLDSWKIPTTAGTYKVNLYGYDAGTEANDELQASIPNPPFLTFDTGGTGVETSITNPMVHIHPGNLGDADPTGGLSDLRNTQHRWLNPVATMTVTVK